MLLALVAGCGGGGGGGGPPSPTPPQPPHTVGGTVTGLSGTVVLTNNGGDNLPVSANGSFTFATALSSGSAYFIRVLAQPANQQCTVAGGAGSIASADIANVTVTCITPMFTVGGSMSGLNGAIVLQDNGGDNLVLTADGPFVFPTALIGGASYQVTILASPGNQVCQVGPGSGTIGSANVTNVFVQCLTPFYGVGGTASGLNGTLVLRNNGSDDLTVSHDGPFFFATSVANGAAYNVTVASKPVAQECAVTSGSGAVAGALVTNVTVTCTTPTFTIGGMVSGLNGTIVLQNNGGDSKSISADGSFTFATSVVNGTTYQVSVLSQPPSQDCTLVSGGGTVSSANVVNVGVTCVTPTFTVGGTVSGLAGTLVLRNNGGDDLTISSDGAFAFASPVAKAGAYSVTIFSKPQAQHCGVKGGSGTMPSMDVSDLKVTCFTFKEGKFVYVPTSDGKISQFQIGVDGGLVPLVPPTVSTGANPVSIVVDPSGRYAYVASIEETVLSTSNVWQYSIGTDGTLNPLTPPNVSTGPGARTIAAESSGHFVYVTGAGNSITGGGISQYAIGIDGTLTPLIPALVSASGGPTGLAIDSAGQHAYVTASKPISDGTVLQYAIGGDGTLSTLNPPEAPGVFFIGNITIDPFDRYAYWVSGFLGYVGQNRIDANGGLVPLAPDHALSATNFPGSVAVHPAGTHVYVGAGGPISMFSIAPDGTLAPLTPAFFDSSMGGTISVGSIPSIAIDPAGRYLYAPSLTSPIGTILQFKIETDGHLTPMTPFTVPSGPLGSSAAVTPGR